MPTNKWRVGQGMGAVTIQQMADRVAALMEERLAVRGRDLAEKLRRGGRRLPRGVRAAADTLATAAQMAQNPKLLLRVDEGQVAEAYDLCLKHLGAVNLRGRRIALLIGMARSIAISLLAVVALVVGVLKWRGYL
ncbi:MAG TPA: hypothetical protein VGA75_13685 [Paracoccaceae bacterium]